MKNILSSLTQDEKSRILEMHKSATSKQYLSEQTSPTGTTQTQQIDPQTDWVQFMQSFPAYIQSNKNIKLQPTRSRILGNNMIEVMGSTGYNMWPIYKIQCIQGQNGYDVKKDKALNPGNSDGTETYFEKDGKGSWKRTDSNYSGSELDTSNKDVHSFLVQACNKAYFKK
jgi:hypothetical protein